MTVVVIVVVTVTVTVAMTVTMVVAVKVGYTLTKAVTSTFVMGLMATVALVVKLCREAWGCVAGFLERLGREVHSH